MMERQPPATWCSDCRNVVSDTRKRHPGSWLCRKHKRLEGMGFVDRDYWSREEPFMRCVNINGGDCPLFDPRGNDNADE
ncbi:hypothetical protein [Pseudohoeflea coraliihabitans]|uniref:Uncharacterized protein n=1 Tax=Pseudohoeflea coraliihabitans TaxID=2860393 RepID=A0ABS6WJ36_9HYPH|nr:hypothetical protein [Pseudohoeflea sp. DP4N28-3]MBW3095673.1 hypothetical protein [Pseudohoeflea sp. DP4N28-3]